MPRTASSGGRSGKRRKPAAERPELPSAVNAKLNDLIPEPGDRIAVALSGGSDSMALLHLTLDWAGAQDIAVQALIVDHGLRAEAAEEARGVAALAIESGAEATVLRWNGPHPNTGIQDAARKARYALMTGWCEANGVTHLLLGHQMEDQAATVLMRVRRGSGVDGLSAMAQSSVRNGITLVRPLLEARREALRNWLTHRSIGWIEDPTNRLERYERNRLDRFLETESGEDDLVASLTMLARRQSQAASALDRIAADQLNQLRENDDNCIRLDRDAFMASPEEIRCRLLSLAVLEISGQKPRLSAVEALSAALLDTGKANAGGVLARLTKHALVITAEPPRR
jgi:tRNA(Ile)-lysidine synthase